MPLEYLTVEHLSTKDLIRIFSKIEIHPDASFNGTPCWIWCATRGVHNGYGQVAFKNGMQKIHRLMFAWAVHALPKDLSQQIDHLCKRPACSNPCHLEFVSARINVHRSSGVAAINFQKTHCGYGHEFTPATTWTSKHGNRHCRPCSRRRDRTRRAKLAARA